MLKYVMFITVFTIQYDMLLILSSFVNGTMMCIYLL